MGSKSNDMTDPKLSVVFQDEQYDDTITSDTILLQLQVQRTQRFADSLQQQCDSTKRVNEIYRQSIVSREEQINALKDSKKDLQREIDSLYEELNRKDESRRQLQEMIRTIHKESEEWKQQYISLQTQGDSVPQLLRKQIRQQTEEFAKQQEEFTQQRLELREEIDKLKADRDEYAQKVQDLTQRLDSQGQQFLDLKSAFEEAKTAQLTADSLAQQLQAQLSQKSNEELLSQKEVHLLQKANEEKNLLIEQLTKVINNVNKADKKHIGQSADAQENEVLEQQTVLDVDDNANKNKLGQVNDNDDNNINVEGIHNACPDSAQYNQAKQDEVVVGTQHKEDKKSRQRDSIGFLLSDDEQEASVRCTQAMSRLQMNLIDKIQETPTEGVKGQQQEQQQKQLTANQNEAAENVQLHRQLVFNDESDQDPIQGIAKATEEENKNNTGDQELPVGINQRASVSEKQESIQRSKQSTTSKKKQLQYKLNRMQQSVPRRSCRERGQNVKEWWIGQKADSSPQKSQQSTVEQQQQPNQQNQKLPHSKLVAKKLQKFKAKTDCAINAKAEFVQVCNTKEVVAQTSSQQAPEQGVNDGQKKKTSKRKRKEDLEHKKPAKKIRSPSLLKVTRRLQNK